MSDASCLPHAPLEPLNAQAILLDHAKVGAVASIPLHEALGKVAGAAHPAKWPLPQWRLSKMDGYAVGAPGPKPGVFELCGESAAGSPANLRLAPGQCMRVSTGAVLTECSYAVVPQEDTQLQGEQLHLSQEGQDQLAAGRYIREVGSDLAADKLVCQRGQRLDVGRLSLLAATGYAHAEVIAAPRIGILSTGSELIPVGQAPTRGQIIATNAMALRWQCEKAGAQVTHSLQVQDSREATTQAIAKLAQSCDLVLTCGGISVGPHDHVLPSLQDLGWSCLFRKVKLAPGRPTTGGLLAQSLVVALPGNPASSYVTFELFIRPVIRKMLGHTGKDLYRPSRWVECTNPPGGDAKRDRYLRVQVQGQKARALSTQQSGDLSSLCGHNALLVIPAQVKKGPYRALLLGEENFEPSAQDSVTSASSQDQ